MKKLAILVLSLSLILIFSIIPINVNAAGTIDPSGNIGKTTFIKKESQEKQIGSDTATPLAGTANGAVSCLTSGTTVTCDWIISVSNDLINYSAVWVFYEKWDSTAGKWVSAGGHNFEYGVNPPVNTIRNQGSDTLPKGNYRAKLGGTFTCVENGVYGAYANSYSAFQVN